MGRPGADSGRARLVSARLPDHAAARGTLLDLALGTLAALHEAEFAPEQLPALEGDPNPSPNLSPGGAHMSGPTAQPGVVRPDGAGPGAGRPSGGVSGTEGSHGASPTEAPAPPPRSVAAALAAPQLRCRASWFRELLLCGQGAAPHAALLRSLVDALEVRVGLHGSGKAFHLGGG